MQSDKNMEYVSNAIAPGPFLQRKAWEKIIAEGDLVEKFDMTKKKVPAKKSGRPSGIRKSAAYLVSDFSAHYINLKEVVQ